MTHLYASQGCDAQNQLPESHDSCCSPPATDIYTTGNLCATCKRLQHVFPLADSRKWDAQWIPLVVVWERARCPLCRFMHALFADPVKEYTYDLLIVVPSIVNTVATFFDSGPTTIRLVGGVRGSVDKAARAVDTVEKAWNRTKYSRTEHLLQEAPGIFEKFGLTWIKTEHHQKRHCSTEISLSTGHPHGSFVNASRIDFARVRHWLSICSQHHNPPPERVKSEARSSLRLDLKLIDCTTRVVVEAPPGCQYVALSYVWGSCGTINICRGAKQTAFLPKTLPRTIEDAIIVTISLHLRYLWVDQVCIDQSDPDTVHQQISSMHSIYGSAMLTLIAATGTDADSGLSGISKPRTLQERINLNGRIYFVDENFGRVINDGKWNTRGWTYQEEQCSTRRLYFTSLEVVARCRYNCSKGVYECNMERLQPSQSKIRLGLREPDRPVSVKMMEHIRDYTRRNLSYQSDALNAIRGVLNFEADLDSSKHIWGMPIHDGVLREADNSPSRLSRYVFARSLLWQILPDHEHSIGRRPGFPSWSWAGWIGPVTWAYIGRRWLPRPYKTWSELINGLAHDPDTASLPDFEVEWCKSNRSCTFDSSKQEDVLYTHRLGITSTVIELDVSSFRMEPDYDDLSFWLEIDTTYHEKQCVLKWYVSLTFSPHDLAQKERLFSEYVGLQVVVIKADSGLVVARTNDGSERLGTIDLVGIAKANDDAGYQYHAFPGSNFQDHFPGERKKIMLS